MPITEKRPLDRLLAHFENIAGNSSQLLAKSLGQFESDGQTYWLPRYLILGPQGGVDTIRLGIFAAINGDEPEGAFALLRLAGYLEQFQSLARGYALFLYPVCNPTGFEDNTARARRGTDLNAEFWNNSSAPELRSLESEIWTHAFHGIITLHSDATADGLYGFVNGEVLSEHLLEPALREAGQALPRSRAPLINGSFARNGIIHRRPGGTLGSIPGLIGSPFELSVVTPRRAPVVQQVEAYLAALQTILIEYRLILSTAQNI